MSPVDARITYCLVLFLGLTVYGWTSNLIYFLFLGLTVYGWWTSNSLSCLVPGLTVSGWCTCSQLALEEAVVEMILVWDTVTKSVCYVKLYSMHTLWTSHSGQLWYVFLNKLWHQFNHGAIKLQTNDCCHYVSWDDWSYLPLLTGWLT